MNRLNRQCCASFRRAAIKAAAIAAVLLIPSATAHAADSTANRMLDAYRAWVSKHGLAKSSVAIIRNGRMLVIESHGPTTAYVAEPIASVSKSITGICIVKLVENGRLRYDSTLGELMRGFFTSYGGPADPRFASITVAQLLTHTSGIGDTHINANKVRLSDQVRDTVRLQLARAPGASHHYDNKNFQVLGLVVELVTGESYEAACRRLVLVPASAISAHISRLQPFMSSWAGWVVSVRDYALFMKHFDPRFGLLRTGPRDWPKVDLGNRWFYSVGLQLRHNEDDTYSFVHSGVWTWRSPQLNYQFMARFVYFGSHIGFVMNASPAIEGLGHDLEHEMWKASLPQAGDVVFPQ